MWVARDKNKLLFLYDKKPKRNNNVGEWGHESIVTIIDEKLFPKLKWKDKPIKVTLAEVK